MDLLKPASLEEAVAAGARDGCAYLGGGTWLNAGPDPSVNALISLESLGLDYIHEVSGEWRIGSGVRFQDLVDHDGVPEIIRGASASTASRTLRNMITLGGDLGLHAPGSCMVPVLMVLDARVAVGVGGGEIGVMEYLEAQNGALIREVVVPANRGIAGLKSLSRTSHSRKCVVCAVSATISNGTVVGLRVVAGDCVSQPVRLVRVEELLRGSKLPAKPIIEEAVKSEFQAEGDFHSSADYKEYFAGVSVADLLHRFLATGGAS